MCSHLEMRGGLPVSGGAALRLAPNSSLRYAAHEHLPGAARQADRHEVVAAEQPHDRQGEVGGEGEERAAGHLRVPAAALPLASALAAQPLPYFALRSFRRCPRLTQRRSRAAGFGPRDVCEEAFGCPCGLRL